MAIVLVAERLFEPGGVLDRAREHGDAVGHGGGGGGDLRAQAGGVGGWADDFFGWKGRRGGEGGEGCRCCRERR